MLFTRSCICVVNTLLEIAFSSPQIFWSLLCHCETPGDGGGGDGSSGSEESGNDGGVSTIPLPTTNVQTTYDALRGLGIVGSSAVGKEDVFNQLPHTEVGVRQTCN